MFRTPTPAAGGRPGWIALGLVVGALTASTAHAQSQTQTQTPPTQQPPPAQPAQQAQTAPTTRVFASDAGLVLNFIKPDKTTDFEAVMAKLKEALQKSPKPERKQQAASWKVFKSPEPAQNGNVLYVFVIAPAVKSGCEPKLDTGFSGSPLPMPVVSTGAASAGSSVESAYSNAKPITIRPAPAATPFTRRFAGVVVAPMKPVMSAKAGVARRSAAKTATTNVAAARMVGIRAPSRI